MLILSAATRWTTSADGLRASSTRQIGETENKERLRNREQLRNRQLRNRQLRNRQLRNRQLRNRERPYHRAAEQAHGRARKVTNQPPEKSATGQRRSPEPLARLV